MHLGLFATVPHIGLFALLASLAFLASVPFMGLGSDSVQERLAETSYAGGFWSTSASVNFTLTPQQQVSSGSTFLTLTGAGPNAVTTPTALLILLQIQALIGYIPPVGFTFQFEISNQGAGTTTLTAGTGVTINGVATVATTTNRTWLGTVTANGATPTVTFQNLGGRNN